MDMKLPRSLAIVVRSEVLGTTVVSVEAHTWADPGASEDIMLLAVKRGDVEAAVEAEETRYLDSHREAGPVEIDRQALARAASALVLAGDRTWDSIAADCGWTREDAAYSNGRRGDGQKVRELLGVAENNEAKHRPLDYDDANALVKVIGVDPVDVGL